MTGHLPRVVALGGGHGLAASLQALRQVTPHLTAVVTVADDGGSSGRLRSELSALPPGDLRMALAALAGPDRWGTAWAELLQHRFPGEGPLGGHAVGNLLLVGLTQSTGDVVTALEMLGGLLGCAGRVLPASGVPLQIVAEVQDSDGRSGLVVGQVAVATTTGRVSAVSLRPADPPACAEAVKAIDEADYVVLGPGSWFTSVLPHLLVPGLRDALERTNARRVVTLNLAPQTGETSGFSPEAHIETLLAFAPGLRIDVVLADQAAVVDTRGLMTASESAGGRLVLAPVALGDGSPRHDPDLLAAALTKIMDVSPERSGRS